MPAKDNYFKLGLFVVLSLGILALLLFLLGGRSVLQPKVITETYFNESVAGLEVGAPVKFRGVPLGQVSEIQISSRIYKSDMDLKDNRNYIVVRMRIDGIPQERLEALLDSYVKRGLRAKTALAGLTGQLFVSLDFETDPPKPLPFDWKPQHPYVPSAPSLANEILANAQNFLGSLDKADIARLGHNLNKLVVTIDEKVNGAHVDEMIAEAMAALREAHATLGRIDRAVSRGQLDSTLANIHAATARLEKVLGNPALESGPRDFAATFANLRRISESGGELERLVTNLERASRRTNDILGANEYDLHASVVDLRATLENLRALSELARRDPSALIFSPPPQPVVLGRGAR